MSQTTQLELKISQAKVPTFVFMRTVKMFNLFAYFLQFEFIYFDNILACKNKT